MSEYTTLTPEAFKLIIQAAIDNADAIGYTKDQYARNVLAHMSGALDTYDKTASDMLMVAAMGGLENA